MPDSLNARMAAIAGGVVLGVATVHGWAGLVCIAVGGVVGWRFA